MAGLGTLSGYLRRFTARAIGVAQRGVMVTLLFLLYFLGIGVTWLLSMVFQRARFRWDPPGRASYWQAASGYEPDLDRARRQT